MHDLFAQVLNQRDLSKAGDLFSLDDKDVEEDLSNVIFKIKEIASGSDYLTNDNDQSVVEICITRATSAIRETNSIEKHAPALVSLLESCLAHDLKPSAKDEDPPHAKIASDIMSSIFLNYSKKPVMELALPVAVKFLHQGNKELSRNMSSYLSLAAIDNAKLLSQHIQPIIDSIIGGNRTLARVLPQIYAENKEPMNTRISDLIQILPESEASEKNSLLQLCGLVAKEKPVLLDQHIPKLCDFLASPTTSTTVLQAFVDMATTNPEPFLGHLTQLKHTAEQQPATLALVARIVGAIGKIKGQERSSLNYLVSQLDNADNNSLPVVLKEIKALAETNPTMLSQHIGEIAKYSQTGAIAARMAVQQIRDLYAKGLTPSPTQRKALWDQTQGTVTVITVGNPHSSSVASSDTVTVSTSPATTTNVQPTKNASLPKPKVSSVPKPKADTVKEEPKPVVPPTGPKPNATTASSFPVVSTASVSISVSSSMQPAPAVVTTPASKPVSNVGNAPEAKVSERPSSVATTTTSSVTSASVPPEERSGPTSPSSTPTIPPSYTGQPQAIPFPDAVQQFCSKHLDKIKLYIDNAQMRLPIPIKANLEESKHKRYCKIHFICYGFSEHCIYNQNFFHFKTKLPRLWIHIMFLSIQAKSQHAVSQQDPSVGNLKALWDTLKLDSGNSFVRLVTSSFPSTKDQDALLHELQNVRYFDIFEFNAAQKHWACFLCNHPEKVTGLLQDGNPVIEGQLKEKKGRWKFFKRWKTRYFTLSGAQIISSKKDSVSVRKETLPVSKIQSVKAVRKGMRDIPKAFEIFTNDQTYVFKAKDGKHAEQWVQCLHIAVARSQKREMPAVVNLRDFSASGSTRPSSAGNEAQTKL